MCPYEPLNETLPPSNQLSDMKSYTPKSNEEIVKNIYGILVRYDEEVKDSFILCSYLSQYGPEINRYLNLTETKSTSDWSMEQINKYYDYITYYYGAITVETYNTLVAPYSRITPTYSGINIANYAERNLHAVAEINLENTFITISFNRLLDSKFRDYLDEYTDENLYYDSSTDLISLKINITDNRKRYYKSLVNKWFDYIE